MTNDISKICIISLYLKKKNNYSILSITLHANIYITCFGSNLDQVQRHGWAKRAILSGTGVYLKRKALYWKPNQEGIIEFSRRSLVVLTVTMRLILHVYFCFLLLLVLLANMVLFEPEKNFGTSSKFIDSLKGKNLQLVAKNDDSWDAILQEARLLASYVLEANTECGKEASIT